MGESGISIGYPLVCNSCDTVVSNGSMDGMAGPGGNNGHRGLE